MEEANPATNAPKDKHLIVYFIILIHGIGILMPWNMFITAKDYFENYKLGKAYTHSDEGSITFYVTYFMTFLSVFGQFPNVVFNWVNIFINLGGSLTSRIVYSIVLEVLIFLFTEFMVIIDSSTWPGLFFWITMASVFALNVVNGIYQSTVYGIAARLPPKYSGAVIIGNNISGIFAAVVSIATKMSSPDLRTAAFFYFLIALFVLFTCFVTYFALTLNNFYKYYDLLFENELKEALKAEPKNANNTLMSYWTVLKACSLQCFNAFFIFLISLTIFPAVQSAILSSSPGNFIVSDSYFVDVTCFLTFNFFATVGSLLSTVITWPGPNRLHIPVLLRAIFVPLFLFCNYQVDGRKLPIYIHNDYVYWIIGIAFALSSGYFSSLAMMYCGKSVPPEDSTIAGMFGAAFLVSGVFIGVVTSFIWPIFVKTL